MGVGSICLEHLKWQLRILLLFLVFCLNYQTVFCEDVLRKDFSTCCLTELLTVWLTVILDWEENFKINKTGACSFVHSFPCYGRWLSSYCVVALKSVCSDVVLMIFCSSWSTKLTALNGIFLKNLSSPFIGRGRASLTVWLSRLFSSIS